MRQQIASAIHAVVQIARLLRRHPQGDLRSPKSPAWKATSSPCRTFSCLSALGIDEDGKVRGVFRATGIRPKFADRLATAGCRLRPDLFESRMEV